MADTPRVVFGSGFDGLFSKEIRAQLTPPVEAKLRALGLQLDRPFLPGYPIETWVAALDVLCEALHPRDAKQAALWKLGRSTMQGFGETLVGKAAFAFMRLVGPVRSVERAARSYANGNNYTQVKLERMGPTSFHFYLNEKHTLPEFDMGVVEAMLEHIGAKQPQVTLVSRDAEGFTMKLEWQA